MPTWVLSDLHLDEAGPGRLFDDDRQGKVLERLCERIALEPDAELVLLGDTFDLTAMLPPRRGLDAFARRVDVPLSPPPRRSAIELCAAVARSNPRALAAIASLAGRCPVTMVPGNHDWQLSQPEAPAMLAAAGLSQVRLAPYVERDFGGRTAVLMHGHHFDPGNKEPGGTGEAMTACLHHAAIPFLIARCKRRNVRVDPDRIVALRPEEAILTVLQRWLTPDDFKRFFHAFMDLLADNGYLPQALAFLAHVVPVAEVRKQISKADRVWEKAADVASEVLNGKEPLPLGAPRPDVLVLGHTHVLDWATVADDKLYVNLGTWTERAHDAMSPLDTTLPVLELRLHQGAPVAVLRDLDERGGELNRYESTPG